MATKKKTEIAARPQQAEHRTTAKPTTESAPGKPSHDAVSLRAFQLWKDGGCQAGQELENWLRAETELLSPTRRA